MKKQRGGIRTFAILGAILTVLVAVVVSWVIGRWIRQGLPGAMSGTAHTVFDDRSD